MSATSFLTPMDVAAITQIKRDAFATSVALAPFTLTLYRYAVSTGQDVALAPQTVVLRYDNQQARDAISATAEATYIEGTFVKDAPFDVLQGDHFTLPTGQSGVITAFRDRGVTVTASFRIDEGRSS